MVSCRNINKDVIINRLLSLHASWIPSRVTKLRHRYPGSVVPHNLLSFINFICFIVTCKEKRTPYILFYHTLIVFLWNRVPVDNFPRLGILLTLGLITVDSRADLTSVYFIAQISLRQFVLRISITPIGSITNSRTQQLVF